MNEKFLYKKVQQCFLNYNHDLDVMPFPKKDYEIIAQQINDYVNEHKKADLHVIIHDVVYEYLSKN
ncbi:hypothetical protein CIB95_03660 [Lottiidibacillus patelloidae]|uniref:YqzH-like protein n=1 Tax=Lottiidibacillus patelloidae TaxID=2670334 RepID=A0A263BZI2_9BACI|nr:YqzH family protein [Lottiidibacillus patelloidae]OZM58677.1 hypothetical protein CIB95_03660 [Lottiidibacillus patelloidae]